ncbi:calcium-binding protein [Cognatishimia sp. F0-27]|uniref:calcium-binding protein n=1 Tax=Cognatishimia sp. F0-27 TaxID=2816855 RepID=UPI001D0C4777|nr:hypothetical protein [Cognatishimia sp. F0-27]MCC1495091.1 hypothetical protein [Cognatishimia sp. F0-27]
MASKMIWYTPAMMETFKSGGETWKLLSMDHVNANAHMNDIHYGGYKGLISTGLTENTVINPIGDYYTVPKHGIFMDESVERNDFFITQKADDIVYAGAGYDTVSAESGNDEIDGGSGHDKLYGGAGDDTIYGGTGNDYISGDGFYAIDPDGGVLGGGWGDLLLGGPQGQLAEASRYGGYTWDIIKDADFAGYVEAIKTAGRDELLGGEGNDTIEGGLGGDWMNGGAGDDVLIAGGFDGNGGRDVMIGDGGADIFFLTSNIKSDATDDAQNAIIDFLGETGSTVIKAAGSAVVEAGATALGGPVAGFIAGQGFKTLINLAELANQSAARPFEGNSAVTVIDFDPRFDTLVLPQTNAFSLSVRTVFESEIAHRGTEKAIVVTYDDGTGAQTYATIFLSEAFTRDIDLGTGGLNGDVAADILQQQIDTAATLTESGLSGMVDFDGATLSASGVAGATGVTVMGAASAKVLVNIDTDSDAPLIGTQFGDIIGANNGWVTPGTEGDFSSSRASQVETEKSHDIYGFGGDDILQGNATAEMIHGGSGDDLIFTMGARGGQDVAYGGSGNDTIKAGADFGATDYADGLYADGGRGVDAISFEFASQGVALTANGRTISGQDAGRTDTQYTLKFFEALAGSAHADEIDLSGSSSGMEIDGLGGKDTLSGSDRDDTIDGGAGWDEMTGNDGADTFVFSAGSGYDRITDFNAAEGDQIDLSGMNTVTSYFDMMANHIAQNGADVIIRGNNGEGTLRIEDVTIDTLNADDFLF